jgi:hypothetical protein
METEQYQTINLETRAYVMARYQPDSPVKERFFSWWGVFAEFFNQRPFDLIYMDQLTVTPLYTTVGSDETAQYYQESRSIITDGQEQGLIKDGDISLLNQFVRIALVNLIKLHHSKGKNLDKGELKAILNLCWDGLAIH